MEIVIRNNNFKCRLYDIDTFMDMPLANTRKLLRLMFGEIWSNEESIETLRAWLLNKCAGTGALVIVRESDLAHATELAETTRSAVAVFGSVATKDLIKALKAAKRNMRIAKNLLITAERTHEKVLKLQTFFNELIKEYESEEKHDSSN